MLTDSQVGNIKQSNGPVLEVLVVNTGSDTVTVQTRGHQHYLVPWGILAT